MQYTRAQKARRVIAVVSRSASPTTPLESWQRSGIRSDPNRADDPEYIVNLVGRVIRVSLETIRIANSLPPL